MAKEALIRDRERLTWGMTSRDKKELVHAGEVIVFSPKSWGEEYQNPLGFFDGDAGPSGLKKKYCRRLEDLACDLYGNVINDIADLESWNPDIDFIGHFDLESGVEALADEGIVDDNDESLLCDFDLDYGVEWAEYMSYVEEGVQSHLDSDEYYEDGYAYPRYQKNSPWLVAYEPRVESRRNTGCLHSQKYKNYRKGGGRLSRRESRALEDIFEGATTQLFVPPRVAVVSGSPEDFPLTRRRRKRLR